MKWSVRNSILEYVNSITVRCDQEFTCVRTSVLQRNQFGHRVVTSGDVVHTLVVSLVAGTFPTIKNDIVLSL